MDGAFNVPDSTDWLNTSLKDFAALENVLHCQICKEFYDTPMITTCNHTFCSRCIRTSLSADGKCPACRAADQASKLRNNWAIQEVTATFLAARPKALEVARKAQAEADDAPKRPGKRKRNPALEVEAEEFAETESSGRTTRKKSRRVAASQGSQPETIEIEDSEDGGDEEYHPEAEPEQPKDGLVECPLGCGKRMKEAEVFNHLDKCEDEQKQAARAKSRTPLNGFVTSRPSSSQNQGARPQDRINELSYGMLKDAAMSKKLKDQGIPNFGSKQLMVNRHKEWVNIWNANCDSNKPRTRRELLHDLDVWERTQGGKAPHGNGLTGSIMRKDYDGAAHAKRHQDDFSRLIADARRKKNIPATEPPPAKDDAVKDSSPIENGKSPFFSANPPSLTEDEQSKEQTSLQSRTNLVESKPYEHDPEALEHVREKVAVNEGRKLEPPMNEGFQIRKPSDPSGDSPASHNLSSPFSGKERKLSHQLDNPPSMFNSTIDVPESGSSAAQTATSKASPISLDATLPSLRRPSSHDEHAVHKTTGSPCDLPAHLYASSPKRVPMFAIPEQPVTDVDGGGAGSHA